MTKKIINFIIALSIYIIIMQNKDIFGQFLSFPIPASLSAMIIPALFTSAVSMFFSYHLLDLVNHSFAQDHSHEK